MMRAIIAAILLTTSAAAAAEPLTFHNGRLFIRATINQVATEALLDSGAEGSIVDPALAARAKFAQGTAQTIKGSGGAAPARVVEGVTINALGVELHPEAVIVLDLSDLSTRLIKRPTQAIMGRELFDSARLQIDIANGQIAVASRDKPPPGRELPLVAHAGIESIPVVANGIAAQADFDLGNGSEVMISRTFAKKLKLKIIGQKSGGGIGGALDRDLVRLKTLEVAGTRFRDVVAAIDDQPSHNDLNIGTSILKSFLITADFKGRAVWLKAVGRTN